MTNRPPKPASDTAQPPTSRAHRRLQVGADELLPRDGFTARGGPWAGLAMEVVEVLPGRYGTYRVVARVREPVVVSVDYSERIEVERPITSERKD